MATVVCYGDSNTHGADPVTHGRFARDVRWPGVLTIELGAGVHVIEEGLNGRTTLWDDPFMDFRNGKPYLLPCLRSHQPVDVLVLMLGTNDLKSIFGRAAARDRGRRRCARGHRARVAGPDPDGGAPARAPRRAAAPRRDDRPVRAVGLRRGAAQRAEALPAAVPERRRDQGRRVPRCGGARRRRPRRRRPPGRGGPRRPRSGGRDRRRDPAGRSGGVRVDVDSPRASEAAGRSRVERGDPRGVRKVRAPQRRVAGNARPP